MIWRSWAGARGWLFFTSHAANQYLQPSRDDGPLITHVVSEPARRPRIPYPLLFDKTAIRCRVVDVTGRNERAIWRQLFAVLTI
jgi:hypothetical protein